MFKRKIEDKINNYINNYDGKIMIINGARQVGKSYIVRHVCKDKYKYFVEINLADDYEGNKLFENVKTIEDFYLVVSLISKNNLGSFEDTMIFLDEIQIYPRLLSMLKSLSLDNKYHYIVSGSLLGVTLKHIFIPTGYIQEVKMYPMDFEEFLWANGVSDDVISYLRDRFYDLKEINNSIHELILRKFKEYLVCGGLPDAVKFMVEQKDIIRLREYHHQIYSNYVDDASKYDMEHKLKIERIYSMLKSFMTNKVKRIIFRDIENKKSKRSSNYIDEFDYLVSSGIALRASAISEPKYPLSLSINKNLTKLYYGDVGILSYLLFNTDISSIIFNDKGANLGSIYETVAAMELAAHGKELFYFDSKKVGEVDFLINDYSSREVLPIEIKSGNDQNNFRAIPKLVGEDSIYKLPKGYVFGNKNISSNNNGLITLPIYMIMFI